MTLVKGNSAKEINTSLLAIQKEVDDINRKLDSNTIVSNNNNDIKIDTVLNANSKNAIANSAVYNALNIESITRESQDEYLNEEIKKLKKDVFLIAHPVGSYWSTSEDTDPNIEYGGTWKKITGKFLYAADNETPVGNTGGSKTTILTVDNLPSHSHIFTPKGSLNSTGAHTHTRGTMEITGEFGVLGYTNYVTFSGAFSKVGTNSPGGMTSGEIRSNAKFTASKGWTGATSSNGSHTHTFTGNTTNTSNVGNNKEISNMPPYLSVNTWHRIA